MSKWSSCLLLPETARAAVAETPVEAPEAPELEVPEENP